MSKKVSDVKIEKKTAVAENFKKKGLPELLSEVNFSIDTTEQPKVLMKKFVSAVKRKFKPEYLARKKDEKLTFFNQINIHPIYRVEMSLLNRNDDLEFYEYMRELLYLCQPKAQRTKQEDVTVVKITTYNGGIPIKGFGILDGEIGSSYHRTSRAFSRRKKYGYKMLYDIPSLIAETFMFQSLIDFAKKNKELVKYLFVERNLKKEEIKTRYVYETIYPKLPISEEFNTDYINVAKKYGFDYEEAKESEMLEKQIDAFYVRKEHIGTNRNMFDDYLMNLVVGEFIKESDYVQYKTNEELKERSDYAKAFETKKQIKKTHQERMDNNVFLKRYGFVELDNDVDLKKFGIIEENFMELCEKLYVPKRNDYSFRIKKLGKHRAAGIFFPYYKTTIFDLNHPDAFVHELMHQIDSILAEGKREDYFSEMIEFRGIYDAYKRIVSERVDSLPENHPFRQEWHGKNKYNKSYYLKPTEVFARSGEIYVALKGIDNSLMKTRDELENEHVYTFDKNYTERVVKFFDDLLSELEKNQPVRVHEKKINKVKQASSGIVPKTTQMVVEYTNSEQLSLF